MNENNKSTVFAGGILLVIVVIGLAMKAIEKLMIQISMTADAVGTAAQSFTMMALKIGLVLALIGFGGACVYAAVYFTYRYYKLVKRATDLQAEVDRKLKDFSNQVNSIIRDFREDTRFDLNQMSRKLSEALDTPEIAPEKPLELAVVARSEASDALPAVPDQNSTQENLSPQNVTNPF